MANMYPNNIIGVMFRILDALMGVCNLVVENLFKTPYDILNDWLSSGSLPEWASNVISTVLTWSTPLFRWVTLFDFLFGGALILVVLVGIAKYFTDLFGA